MGERGFLIVVFICGSLLLVLVPTGAFTWGTATHAYFAKELGQGKLNSQEIYGATAPDLFNLKFDSPYYDYIVDQTHRHETNLKTKARKMGLDTFAFGFVSHNERWGADYTAHRRGRTTKEGYVITKSSGLAPKLKSPLQDILENAGVPSASFFAGLIAPELAHPLIETAVDLLIKRNEDPSIGLEMFDSAQDRATSIPDLLVSAYAKGLARHQKLSYDEASQIIREAEAEYQQMMILYGEVFTQEESEAIQDLADQGATLIEGYIKSAIGKEVDVPSNVLVDFIHLALQEVEGDYGQEIASTLAYLKHRPGISSFLHRILKTY
jgi:hypothetical protein